MVGMGGSYSKAHFKPDAQYPDCAKCQKKFSFFTRRHHCRNCGEVFCDACSFRRAAVPSRGITEAVRLCDTCYMGIVQLSQDNRRLELGKPRSPSPQPAGNGISDSVKPIEPVPVAPKPVDRCGLIVQKANWIDIPTFEHVLSQTEQTDDLVSTIEPTLSEGHLQTVYTAFPAPNYDCSVNNADVVLQALASEMDGLVSDFVQGVQASHQEALDLWNRKFLAPKMDKASLITPYEPC